MSQDRHEHREVVRAASEWISRIEAGKLKEPQTLTEWLSEDAARQDAVRELMQVTRVLRSLTPAEWAEVRAAIEDRRINVVPLRSVRELPVNDAARPLGGPMRLWSVAAAIVAVSLIGLLVQSVGAWPTRYRTGIGQRTFVPLPDGSTVELNTRSRIAVFFTSKHREVRLLAGEALFDVQHDPARPFRVVSGTVVIEDVGTQFDVDRHGPGTTTVAVVEGQVDVHVGARAVRVSTDQVATVEGSSPAARVQLKDLSQPEMARRLSWQTGWLTFEGETLAEVIQAVNRYHSPQLVIRDPAVAALQFGGTFRAVDLESLIAGLKLTAGLTAVTDPRDANVIELKRPARAAVR